MATSRSLALMAGIVGAIAGGLAGGIAGKKATQITHDVGGTIQKVEKPASDPVETTASKVKKEQVETTGAAENKDDPYYKYLLAFVDD